MPTKTKSATAVMEEPALTGEELELPEEGDYAAGEDDFGTADDGYEEEGEESEEGEALLSGADLLAFYEEQAAAGVSHKDIAYKAGYYSVTKKGVERINGVQFSEALLEAKGLPISKAKPAGGGRNYPGARRARVSAAGMLLVSQLAVRNVGGVPGAIFSVSYPGDGSILLTPTGEITPMRTRDKGEEVED